MIQVFARNAKATRIKKPSLILGAIICLGATLGQAQDVPWDSSLSANRPVKLQGFQEDADANGFHHGNPVHPSHEQREENTFTRFEPNSIPVRNGGSSGALRIKLPEPDLRSPHPEPMDDEQGDIWKDTFGEDANYGLSTTSENESGDFADYLAEQAEQLTAREGTASTIKIALLLGALSLAPALVLMTTSYVRVVVVLSLLRQAFGGQQLPPTQVITSLSLFLTLLVMAPVWNEIKTEAIDPYANTEQIEWKVAWERGVVPVKRFMTRQINAANNGDSIAMLYKYVPEQSQPPESAEDIPLNVLLPAFMISELKVAFLLGFQIFLPFLVVDLVVSTVTVSMGMLMLPPTMVSFPLKLILFVMVDGWSLVVGMLLQSFGPFT